MKYISKGFIIALLLAIFSSGYARRGGKDNYNKRGPRRPEMHEGERPRHRNRMSELFTRIMGNEDVMEKYDIQIRRVFLDAKEEMISIRRRIRKEVRNFRKVNRLYKKNPARYKDELYKKIQVLQKLIDEKHANRNKAMEQIKKINDKKEKEINQEIKKWMKKAKGNQAELSKFSDVFEELYGN